MNTTPTEILHRFEKERKKYFCFLKDVYAKRTKILSKSLNIPDIEKIIVLNTGVLVQVVDSYFCDLYRTKDFHKIEFEDRHKQAAFTIKWISKLRPVQLLQNNVVNRKFLVINETFAIFAGLRYLKISHPDLISPVFMRNLIYILHYRTIAPMVLASQMYLLERAAKQEMP